MDDAEEAWLEREEEIIEKALGKAWAYQFGVPSDSDFISDFTERLERSIDERDFFIKSYRDEHSDMERIFDREDIRSPDSIEEMFCGECGALSFQLFGVEDATYCGTCYEDLDLDGQGNLQDYRPGSRTYVLIGCGSDKYGVAGMVPARDLYSSGYFEKKLEFGEELGDRSLIVSAKFGLVRLDTVIWNYDAPIDDVDVDCWMDVVEQNLEEWPEWEEQDELWVLLGQSYLGAESSDGRSLRKLLNQAPPEVYYPFEQTSGIGDQQQYLDEAVEFGEPVMPYQLNLEGQTGLNQFQ